MKKLNRNKIDRHDKAAQKLLSDVPETHAKDETVRLLATMSREKGWLERLMGAKRNRAIQQRIVGETAFEAYVEKAPISEVCDLLTYTLEERISDFSTTSGDLRFRGFAWGVRVGYNNDASHSPEEVEYDVAVGSMLDHGMFETVHIIRHGDGNFDFEREYRNDFNAEDDHAAVITPEASEYTEQYIKQQLIWAIDAVKNGPVQPAEPARA